MVRPRYQMRSLDAAAGTLGVSLEHFQSNVEGELVQKIQDASKDGYAGALINAAGYTHTSVAIRDALLATSLPFVEVHISCISAREAYRHTSLLSDLGSGCSDGIWCFWLRIGDCARFNS